MISSMFERIRHPARGRHGGGAPGRVYIEVGEELRGKGQDVVPARCNPGDETPGGGGTGNPVDRDPDALARDEEAELL